MILCIDTATEKAGIGLVMDIKYTFLELDRNNASGGILETIDSLFKKSNSDFFALNGIFVIKGPGSFTGLRVGISVANQFAHQLQIPIIGIKSDEFYSFMVKEIDFIYLQTMNKDQIYMSGHGKFAEKYPQQIIPISESLYELSSEKNITWGGQLRLEHKEKFSKIKEAEYEENIGSVWLKVSKKIPLKTNRRYALVEPYYGKDPTITKTKNQ